MAAGSIPLNQVDSVVLDGAGNGTLKMRPDGSHEYWLPDTASVKATSLTPPPPANEAQCNVYIGPKVDPLYFVDGTYTGSSGTSTGRVSGYRIGRQADPYIIAVWTGGDPGAVATMRIQGTKVLG